MILRILNEKKALGSVEFFKVFSLALDAELSNERGQSNDLLFFAGLI
jgi:hypothetical protein